MLDLVQIDSLLLLRSFSCSDSIVPVLNFANSGPAVPIKSFTCSGSLPFVFDLVHLESLLPAHALALLDSFLLVVGPT